jgi:predicted RND superfamily exporter protein
MDKESGKKNFMKKIAAFIVEKRNLFFLLVILGFIFSAFSVRWVEVENDLVYYLPPESETKFGMEIMENHFVTFGNANVMVANITYEDALAYAEDITEVEGVQSVMFDQTTAHYQNASALYTVMFDYEQYDSRCETSLEEVKEVLAGQDVYIGSEIGYSLPDIIAREVEVIMVCVAVIIILVLLLTSQTYAEIPVLLLTFIVAAVLNMGTNFIMGKISFVSNSVTTVLQLALSLDYAVIFCNRYKEEHKTLPIKEAVVTALSKSIPEITASSMTTVPFQKSDITAQTTP